MIDLYQQREASDNRHRGESGVTKHLVHELFERSEG